jgi:hypothetical protein
VQPVGVDQRHLLGERGLARQVERLGGERRVAVGEEVARRLDEGARRHAVLLEDDRRGEALAASQRLNASSSCAIRCTSSASLYG